MRALFATNTRGRTFAHPIGDEVPLNIAMDRLGLDRGSFIVDVMASPNDEPTIERVRGFERDDRPVYFSGWRVHYSDQGDEMSGTPFAMHADAQARRAALINMGLAQPGASWIAPAYQIGELTNG